MAATSKKKGRLMTKWRKTGWKGAKHTYDHAPMASDDADTPPEPMPVEPHKPVEPEPAPPEAKVGPFIGTLGPGEHMWCACGHSKRQPFCDGSHARTSEPAAKYPEPLKFSHPGGKIALCVCKKTSNPPYCDGSHAKGNDDAPDLQT